MNAQVIRRHALHTTASADSSLLIQGRTSNLLPRRFRSSVAARPARAGSACHRESSRTVVTRGEWPRRSRSLPLVGASHPWLRLPGDLWCLSRRGNCRCPPPPSVPAESSESRPSRYAVAARALTRRPRPRELAPIEWTGRSTAQGRMSSWSRNSKSADCIGARVCA